MSFICSSFKKTLELFDKIYLTINKDLKLVISLLTISSFNVFIFFTNSIIKESFLEIKVAYVALLLFNDIFKFVNFKLRISFVIFKSFNIIFL